MNSTLDNFSGHLKINQKIYVFHTNGHIVKLLPAANNNEEIYENTISLREIKSGDLGYIFGYDEMNNKIAFLVPKNQPPFCVSLKSASFFSTIIIKSTVNGFGFCEQIDREKQTEDLSKFDAIRFSGGTIDIVYNPKLNAMVPFDYEKWKYTYLTTPGAHTIEIKPFSDYTLSLPLNIDKEKAQLTISVENPNDVYNQKTTSIGKLESFIRLEFDNPQDFDKIEKYYRLIMDLLAIATRQRNVCFDVCLNKKKEGKYFKTGSCFVYSGYKNCCKRYDLVQLNVLKPYIQRLLEIISTGTIAPLLLLLPDDNELLAKINLTNVQDMCAALENEYKLSGEKQIKDNLIEELKLEIKEAIEKFSNKHNEIKVYELTTINSSFEYLNFTLKEKILHLYMQHKKVVDSIAEKHNCPNIEEEFLKKFIALRNAKSHASTVNWGGSENLYTPLLALLYSCIFKRIGMTDEDIFIVVSKII